MAEIEIVYRKGYCWYSCEDFDTQCYTQCAGDMGCRFCATDEAGTCTNAKWRYKYKGWSGKNYEIEEDNDPYNPWLDSILVRLGRTDYDCVRVKLNGKTIFDVYDGDGEEE